VQVVAEPAWVTVTFLPATTRVALRLAPPFAATVTTAVPEPVVAPFTDAHDELDDDVHEHPAAVVTDTAAVAEPTWMLSEVGDTEKVHVVAAAAWFTVTFWPATTTVVLRLAPPFAETVTVAVPEPVVAPLTDAHDELDDDVHAHPDVVVTNTVAVPEPNGKLSEVGDTV